VERLADDVPERPPGLPADEQDAPDEVPELEDAGLGRQILETSGQKSSPAGRFDGRHRAGTPQRKQTACHRAAPESRAFPRRGRGVRPWPRQNFDRRASGLPRQGGIRARRLLAVIVEAELRLPPELT